MTTGRKREQARELLAFFSRLAPLSPEEEHAIVDSMLVRTYPEGHVLLREGERSVESYFVLQGLVRQGRLVHGHDRTTGLFSEGEWVLSLDSQLRDAPSMHSLVCLEPSTLVVGSHQAQQRLFAACPRLETVARLTLEQVLAEAQAHAAEHLVATPEERYLALAARRPELVQRVPQYLLASYVGVTPESLSRIRGRLAKRRSR